MGLAASQARLLSITSRMADNELRSQLINNAKMRLTTESSKVSDEYIAALNKTQLMMSNYNLLGEKQYQDLTFNSLTAYSPMNNQYGLVNKTGELLVSELDTARYEEAFQKAQEDKEIEEGDTEGLNAKALEEFLKSYGLEKRTTYFEQDQVYAFDRDLQRMWEGDMVYEYIPATEQNPNPQAIRVSGTHYGYEKSKTSVEYGVYTQLLKDYQAADAAYTAATKDLMKEIVYKAAANGSTYEEKYKALMGDEDLTSGEAGGYQDFMRQIWNNPIKGLLGEEAKVFEAQMEEYLSLNIGDPVKDEATPAPNRGFTTSAEYINAGATVDLINKTITWPVGVNPEDVAPVQSGTVDQIDLTSGPFTEIVQSELTEEQYIEEMKEMYRYFQSGIFGALDRDAVLKKADPNTTEGKLALEAQEEYYEASRQLSQFIYGQDIGEKYYGYLDDMEWILYGDYKVEGDATSGRTNAPYFPTTALEGSPEGVTGEYVTLTDKVSTGEDADGDGKIDVVEEDVDYYCNFQAVIDVYLCEKAMELYGTPKYTWVDVNDPDSDGEAKAQWYTNLFQRMLEGGYTTIEKGLASSQEWLQYALESSLVSMEQVNDDDMWVSTMYTNCSDITESTVDVDITLAEAEYNKKMNAIQAKDKRYDIELKNIDTEHNSLQTEYDSIKSVMDKNVERNFKMFEA